MGNWKSNPKTQANMDQLENTNEQVIEEKEDVEKDDKQEETGNEQLETEVASPEPPSSPKSEEESTSAPEESNEASGENPPPAPPNPSKRTRTKSVIPPPSTPTKEATEHLRKELQKVLSDEANKDGFSIELVEDNLFKWDIYLFGFDAESQIKQDLEIFKEATGKDKVKLEVTFPFNYPLAPPFIRVVYPRFHQYTGHITIGGSVCIKDLTSSGWNSKYDLFSFLVMVRNLLLEGGALIDMDNLSEYSEIEAQQAFQRVAKQHGWLP